MRNELKYKLKPHRDHSLGVSLLSDTMTFTKSKIYIPVFFTRSIVTKDSRYIYNTLIQKTS